MNRLKAWWSTLRESLWLLPAILTFGGAALAFALIEVDERYGEPIELPRWLFAGGYEGARGVLSAIATSIITVTGVVFSVTIVALQLASSEFSPRVLRNFTSDRANQLVLGVFIGTFTYSLLVLRSVRSPVEDADAFVPMVSVTVAVLLALVSIGFLIFFIDHLAQSIQATTVADRVVHDTRDTIRRVFPERLRTGEDGRRPPEEVPPPADPDWVRADRSGYIQSVDEAALVESAREHDLLVRMEIRVGDFVIEGQPLLAIWPASRSEEVERALRHPFVFGKHRTPYQDVERGLIELVDMAVKALSPSINDPTTAVICIDRLTELVVEVGRRRVSDPLVADETGKVRLIARRLTFDDAVDAAFGRVRGHAASQLEVLTHLVQSLALAASLLERERHGALRHQVETCLELGRQRVELPVQRMALEEAGRRAFSALAGSEEGTKVAATVGREKSESSAQESHADRDRGDQTEGG